MIPAGETHEFTDYAAWQSQVDQHPNFHKATVKGGDHLIIYTHNGHPCATWNSLEGKGHIHIHVVRDPHEVLREHQERHKHDLPPPNPPNEAVK